MFPRHRFVTLLLISCQSPSTVGGRLLRWGWHLPEFWWCLVVLFASLPLWRIVGLFSHLPPLPNMTKSGHKTTIYTISYAMCLGMFCWCPMFIHMYLLLLYSQVFIFSCGLRYTCITHLMYPILHLVIALRSVHKFCPSWYKPCLRISWAWQASC